MLNKKIILPLAVVTLGLVSCNSWKSLSEEDAIKRASSIVEKQETIKEEYLNSINYEYNSTRTYKINGEVRDEIVSKEGSLADIDNNYLKYYGDSKIKYYEGETQKNVEYAYTVYFIKNSDKYYRLIEYKSPSSTSTIKTKEVITEETALESIKQYLIKSEYFYNYELTNIKTIFENTKEIQEKIKDKSGQYYNFGCTSNGDANIKLTYDINYVDSEYYEVEYQYKEKSETCWENYLISSSNTDYEYYAVDDPDYVYATNSTEKYSYNCKITQDSINLDEYEEKVE